MTTDRLPGLDPVIHAQARLRLMAGLAALASDERITFPRLQELLQMTAGNLSTHLRKLEDAGYVDIDKTYQRRMPVTWISLSPVGRTAFERYTLSLQALLPSATPSRSRRAAAVPDNTVAAPKKENR